MYIKSIILTFNDDGTYEHRLSLRFLFFNFSHSGIATNVTLSFDPRLIAVPTLR